ncbi:galactokinase [Phycicoccus sp. Root563]|uniref:galactokinase n=1 Tax=Phycicoccus sp. Root563 TaxID=1736562 RepID=UPI0007024E7A|nr:galactokinase [Phycicoccus sp. Root563]KQZ90488.1 galactokinase [Phycicoccus sp. Root563]
MTGPDTAARLFRDTFGEEPDGVWSAPGRVNLIGEHTDYNGGLCMPIALPHRTYAALRRRDDRHLRIVSAQGDGVVELDLDDVGPGSPQGWAAYVAGVPWSLERAGHPVGGFDVAVEGRVPLGAGLSSSAALECAVAAALSDVFDLVLLDSPAGRVDLAAVCVEAENTVAKAPTGGMDQSASLLAQQGHALLLDCRDFSTEQVPFDLAAHDLALLVVDTRAVHELVDGQYAERRDSCEQAARELGVETLRDVDVADLDAALERLSSDLLRRRARHIVTEIARVEQAREALRADDFARLGELFLASHDSMRDDFEISVDELDTAVTSATSAGALGARMTGGGFGGSAIALVRRESADEVRAAVEKSFADKGFRAPECFVVSAAGPAGRDL